MPKSALYVPSAAMVTVAFVVSLPFLNVIDSGAPALPRPTSADAVAPSSERSATAATVSSTVARRVT
jgi:hypothetical protein